MLAGDIPAVLTALPTLLLDQSYSRDFEREADEYAITMMQANALPLTPMAELFVRMGRSETPAPPPSDGKGADRTAPASSEFFSSHPSDAERIARLRAADRK